MEGGGHPRRFVLPRAATGLGPDGALPRGRDEPRPDHERRGYPHLLLRAGELHRRPSTCGRRGARAPQLLRRGRTQLRRHPHRRRHGSCARALDHDRQRRRRHHGLQHRPAAHLPAQPRVPRDPHGREPGPGLRQPLPGQVDGDRPRCQALAPPPPARGPAGVLPRRQRLGEPGLVRTRGPRRRSRASSPGAAPSGSRTGRRSTTLRATT